MAQFYVNMQGNLPVMHVDSSGHAAMGPAPASPVDFFKANREWQSCRLSNAGAGGLAYIEENSLFSFVDHPVKMLVSTAEDEGKSYAIEYLLKLAGASETTLSTLDAAFNIPTALGTLMDIQVRLACH